VAQAILRAYREGRQRPLYVEKLIARMTVEPLIQERQEARVQADELLRNTNEIDAGMNDLSVLDDGVVTDLGVLPIVSQTERHELQQKEMKFLLPPQ